MMIPEITFAGLSVMPVADLLQLLFDKDSMKHLLGLQLRSLFKYAQLTEVVRQIHKLFIG